MTKTVKSPKTVRLKIESPAESKAKEYKRGVGKTARRGAFIPKRGSGSAPSELSYL